jgi:hypothetical protein
MIALYSTRKSLEQQGPICQKGTLQASLIRSWKALERAVLCIFAVHTKEKLTLNHVNILSDKWQHSRWLDLTLFTWNMLPANILTFAASRV